MSWEHSVFALFDDLEQQAEGLALAERDAEVAGLTLAEYAQVTLAARLHASLGQTVRLRLHGGRVLTGRLSRLGEDWVLLVEAAGQEWVVATAALVAATGLSHRAQPEQTWSVVDRLTLRAVCRRIASGGSSSTLHLLDDSTMEGRLARVGKDFVELLVGEGAERTLQVVALRQVAALQERP